MLQTGEIYLDAGGDHYARRDAHTTRRLVAKHERLGYSVTLQEVQGAT